jgi:hypothetical protein
MGMSGSGDELDLVWLSLMRMSPEKYEKEGGDMGDIPPEVPLDDRGAWSLLIVVKSDVISILLEGKLFLPRPLHFCSKMI